MSESASQLTLSLSVAIVTYHTPAAVLESCLLSLQRALQTLTQHGSWQAQIVIIDNGATPAALTALLQKLQLQNRVQVIANAQNVGFGAAHNQAIHAASSHYHLILNPDVEMAPTALSAGLAYLQQQQQVVALSPRCTNQAGQVEYLCKRYPTVLDLLLRGFAPKRLQQLFQKRLDAYACVDLCSTTSTSEVPLISGCWMLCRTPALQAVGGFDARYFLYFEDFALSLALQQHGHLHYFPASQIVHHGGYAARKGWRHIRYFACSAWRFFHQHGWRWW
jgi:GT2 family glycosyltransferase